MAEQAEKKIELPLLPLRDVVVFPHMVIPLFVGRAESVKALEVAMESDKRIFLIAQRDPGNDSPTQKDLYEIGTVVVILQLLRLPDGTIKVLVEGSRRAKLIQLHKKEFLSAKIELLKEQKGETDKTEIKVLMRSVLDQFEQLI